MTDPSELTVVHLLAPAATGGLETVVRALAEGQSDAGARVHVAAVLDAATEDHPFVKALRTDGTDVRVLRIAGRGYRQERDGVASLLDELRANILHTHGYRPDVIDAPVARNRGIATVSTVHGFTGNGLRNRFYEWLQRRAFRAFDAVIAVSRLQVEGLVRAGVPAERVHVIRNAWRPTAPTSTRADARAMLGLTEAPGPIIGWVGRLSPEKGGDVLVRALATPALADAHLCMVGEGRSRQDLEALAHDLGVDARIRWLGRVEDAARLMTAFDVLALPSRTEGTPIVVLEANEAGVPVVASAVGGVPDLLGDGPNVVPPEDPAALAEALATTLASPAEAVSAARRRIERDYQPEAWVGQHLELYRSVAPTRVPGPAGHRGGRP